MSDDLEQVKGDDSLCVKLTLIQFQTGSDQSDHCAKTCGSNDPAPLDSPAVAEVDQCVANETDERAGDRSEQCRHKCQQAILR